MKDETTRATSLVSKVTLRDGNNSSTVYEYTYDLLGNITLIKKDSANLWGYDYDTLGRLVREDDYTSGNTYLYTYDYSGNIQGKHVWPYITNAPTWHLLSLIGYAEMSSVFYTYGNSSWGDQLTAYDGTTISYDASGNPTNWSNSTLDVWYMVWSGRQLTALTRDMLYHTLSFDYNADGVRIKKSNSDYVDEQWVDDTHNYVLDGTKIIKETIEHEVSSTITGTDVLYYYYDESGIAGFEYNGTVYYYLKNIQGDVINILNSSEHLTVNQGGLGSSPRLGATRKPPNKVVFFYARSRNHLAGIIYMVSAFFKQKQDMPDVDQHILFFRLPGDHSVIIYTDPESTSTHALPDGSLLTPIGNELVMTASAASNRAPVTFTFAVPDAKTEKNSHSPPIKYFSPAVTKTASVPPHFIFPFAPFDFMNASV